VHRGAGRGHEDGVGTDVAVDETQRPARRRIHEFMRIGEPFTHLRDDPRAQLEGRGAVGLAEIEDVYEVGVVEQRGELGLRQEHGAERGVSGQMGQDALDHDLLLKAHRTLGLIPA
jgi:hypothetical protein